MLLVFAGVVLVEHLIVFALTVQGPPYPRASIVVARLVQFVLLAVLFWRQRRATLLPTTTAERQLWSIWIGYLLACGAASAGHRVMVQTGKLPDNFMTLYPLWSVLTGLAFFAMGSSYWGRCYVFGVGFFAIGALMAWHLDWAALFYGIAWSATLALMGLHLLRQGAEDTGRRTEDREQQTDKGPAHP
jgi:serine/threonine-protein kinase